MVDVHTIETHIKENYGRFGVNKRREVVRLLFEIAKREGCDFKLVLDNVPEPRKSFVRLKDHLLRFRYPNLTREQRRGRCSAPELRLAPQNRFELKERAAIGPKRFLIEESVVDSELARRVQEKFPDVPATVISTYKEFTKDKPYAVEDFNRRLDDFYIVRERFDFFARCPCSRKSVACGYHVMNLGFGCAFECAYCYLQAYTNAPGIRLPANLDDFFKQFEQYNQNIRLGSGQFTDSLALDSITGYSPRIIEFFRKHPQSVFEFKTKSDNVGLILKTEPAENIIVSWSLNPQGVIEKAEFYTASLRERLEAAAQCAGAGYKVAFHFDPIICYDGWEKNYEETVGEVFDHVDGRKIDCFSLGGLRMPNKLKKAIESRFPDNTILDGELIAGHDGKLRYSIQLRERIYGKMKRWIRKHCAESSIYLCMEEKGLCSAAGLGPVKS